MIPVAVKLCFKLTLHMISAYPPAFTEKERLLCISGLLPVTNTGLLLVLYF